MTFKDSTVPVTIVRPAKTRTDHLADFVAGVLFLLVRAWGVMAAAPLAFNIEPGFWQCVMAIAAFTLFFGNKDAALTWTRATRTRP